MPDAAVHAAGPIIEQLGEVLYSAELPNGKRVLAHLSKALAQAGSRFSPGQRVVMELTPYDFDQARILRLADAPDSGETARHHGFQPVTGLPRPNPIRQ